MTISPVSANFAAGILTLSGTDTLANYQQVLRSITYSNTAGDPGVAAETVDIVAMDDGGLTSNSALERSKALLQDLRLRAGFIRTPESNCG